MRSRILLVAVVMTAVLTGIIVSNRLAEAVAGDHRAMVGLATQSVYILQDEVAHGKPAYDLQMPGSSPSQRAANTANQAVYAQTQRYSGGNWRAYKDTFISGSGCHGVAVKIRNADSGGVVVGRQEYVHINVSSSIPTSWPLPAGWTVTYVGSVLPTDPPPCNWTTTHLHEADELYGSGKTNPDIDTGETWSTGNNSAWLFKYTSN
jgi:hypothetical protein